jgi:hypothetical protein
MQKDYKGKFFKSEKQACVFLASHVVTDLIGRAVRVDECDGHQDEQQQQWHPVEDFSPAMTHLEDSFPCVEEYRQPLKLNI